MMRSRFVLLVFTYSVNCCMRTKSQISTENCLKFAADDPVDHSESLTPSPVTQSPVTNPTFPTTVPVKTTEAPTTVPTTPMPWCAGCPNIYVGNCANGIINSVDCNPAWDMYTETSGMMGAYCTATIDCGAITAYCLYSGVWQPVNPVSTTKTVQCNGEIWQTTDIFAQTIDGISCAMPPMGK